MPDILAPNDIFALACDLTRAQVETQRQGYRQGYQDGYRKAKEETNQEVERLKTELDEVMESIHE